MKKNLVLKINNTQEADFCDQILKKVGIFPINNLHLTFGKGRDHLFVENGKYFFTYKEIVDNAIKRGEVALVNSWCEFILFYLNDFYYLCKSKEEKIQLQKLFFANNLDKKRYYKDGLGKMTHPILEISFGEAWFYKPQSIPNKQEISLDNLTLLINSIGQFEKPTMKTENKTNKTINNTVIHLKDKKERAAAKVYLEGFFEENDLDIGFCREAFNYSNKDCIYFQIDDQYTKIASWYNGYKADKYTNVLSFAELEEFAQLIKEEKKKEKDFTFENGLVAKYNKDNRHIVIGCKEKHFKFWSDFTNNLIKLNEDFSISGYCFAISEIRNFKKWLNNL
jgi:hypothetical protein